MFLVSSRNCLCPIHWSQVLSREWRCSWSSADRRCSNYIWVIDNFIAYWGASYISELTVLIIGLRKVWLWFQMCKQGIDIFKLSTSNISHTSVGNKTADHSDICSWSMACRRCSNYIFILDLTSGFSGLGKDNRKMRRGTFKFWALVHFILEVSPYLSKQYPGMNARGPRWWYLKQSPNSTTVKSLI